MFFLKKLRNVLYRLISALIVLLMKRKKHVSHNGHDFYFSVVNPLTYFRALSFKSKEPETLNWIESFEADSVFWDVGANIGLYSIYAAKVSGCPVYAFEPSVFNLELLCRNINYNKVTSNISVIPLPLFSSSCFENFRITDMSWGGAHSSFSEDVDQNGEKINSIFEYKICGISPTTLTAHFGCPAPDYIKIDVDGVEHLILAGLVPILKNVKSVLVEVNEGFPLQKSHCDEILQSAGFSLASRHVVSGEMFNQIWKRRD